MGRQLHLTHKQVTEAVKKVLGRPLLGPVVRARMPPWVHRQLEALRDGQTGRNPLATVVRDAIIAGLFTFKEHGVDLPGFDPAKALLEARRRGEPTGVLEEPKPKG